MRFALRLVLPILLGLLLLPHDGRGQPSYTWQSNGLPVCTNAADQDQPNIVCDSRGGAYVVWRDARNGDFDIYGQRLRQDGHILWNWHPTGMPICDETGDQGRNVAGAAISIMQDRNSGCFVVWDDWRSGNSQVYAQHVQLTSVVSFEINGITAYPTACSIGYPSYDYPVLTSGLLLGEAVVVIHRRCNSCGVGLQPDNQVAAQKLGSASGVQWGGVGKTVFSTCEQRGFSWGLPSAIADGSGGVCAVWADIEDYYWNIYAGRLNASGVSQWGKLRICNATGTQENPQVVSNQAGGAIIFWEDGRNTKKQIYAQWVYANGTFRWPSNGKLIASSLGDLQKISACSDGIGGAYVAWEDASNSLNKNLFMHHVNINGDTTTSRIPLCKAAYHQGDPRVVSDGAGGCYIAWWDERGGFKDVYAQHVVSNAISWGVDGYPICTAPFDQSNPQVALDEYNGGLLLAWVDWRNGNPDIFAQWVDEEEPTAVGNPIPPILSLTVAAYPNPFNPSTTIRYSVPVADFVRLRVYDVNGRLVRVLVDEQKPGGEQTAVWDGRDDAASQVATGVYFVRFATGSEQVTRKLVMIK